MHRSSSLSSLRKEQKPDLQRGQIVFHSLPSNNLSPKRYHTFQQRLNKSVPITLPPPMVNVGAERDQEEGGRSGETRLPHISGRLEHGGHSCPHLLVGQQQGKGLNLKQQRFILFQVWRSEVQNAFHLAKIKVLS